MTLARLAASTLLFCVSACDSGSAAPADAAVPATDAGGDLPDAGPQIGDLESFATLTANSEGIAFGVDAAGEPTLFVGVLGSNEIVSIGVQGTVTPFVSIPRPLGMAARSNGNLVVCGQADGSSDAPGVLYEVTPDAVITTLLSEDPSGAPLMLTNYVAVAPDDSLVFSDSEANRLYRADADGSNIALVSDAISYPNGLAFSEDGGALYVASWDTSAVLSLSFDRTTGAYGPPESFLAEVDNVDGIVTLASGALVLVTSSRGLLHAIGDETPSELLPSRALLLPANGSAGVPAYGEEWVYLSSLGNSEVWRVRVGEPGASLPIR